MFRVTQVGAAVFIGAAMLVAAAGPAAAHDPIFVSDDQTTPDTGPYMPDGSISWALYGQVLDAEDTRGFEFDLRDGEELYISLLIPNLEPELSLGDDELPTLELTSPDGTVQSLVADQRSVFDEEFSRTSYVTLLERREPAQAGRYRGIVIGQAPSRFTVAIGETEIFFTETERSGDRPSSFMELSAPLQAWYSTPPGGERGEIADDVGIDLDLVEEAMESGEGTIAEGGSLDGEESATEGAMSEDPEPEPASEPETDERAADASPSDETQETASSVADGDDGGSATWVAPVAIAAVVGVGAAAVARRSSKK